MLRPLLAVTLLLIVGVTFALAPPVQAQEITADDVEGLFGGLTTGNVVASGYDADPFCVDGRVAGLPELGTMGFHYINAALVDTTLDPMKPEVVLFGPDGASVVAVEYLAAWEKDSTASSAFGQEFAGPMAGHAPGMPVHYDLHVWLADNPAGQFADFNPSLPLCPDAALPPPPSAAMVTGIYGGMSPDAAIAIGYSADPFCIDGRVADMPELGSMGFHYVNEALLGAPVNPLASAILLVHPTEPAVVAVEYLGPDGSMPRPSLF